MSRTTVIIVAAGNGTRMGSEIPKQFLPIGGIPILVHTVRRFSQLLPQAGIIVVVSADNIEHWNAMTQQYGLPFHEVCAGGNTRFESVRNALAMAPDDGMVLIHDGVRPVVTKTLIDSVVSSVNKYGTGIPAIEPVDSFRIAEAGDSSMPFDRSRLRAIQTPQGFRADVLKKAYMLQYDPSFTDDASVVEYAGTAITLCTGERSNIKVTTPDDLRMAEILINDYRLWK